MCTAENIFLTSLKSSELLLWQILKIATTPSPEWGPANADAGQHYPYTQPPTLPMMEVKHVPTAEKGLLNGDHWHIRLKILYYKLIADRSRFQVIIHYIVVSLWFLAYHYTLPHALQLPLGRKNCRLWNTWTGLWSTPILANSAEFTNSIKARLYYNGGAQSPNDNQINPFTSLYAFLFGIFEYCKHYIQYNVMAMLMLKLKSVYSSIFS